MKHPAAPSVRHLGFAILCPFLLLAGCASNDVCLAPVGDSSLTPALVSATGDYVGKSTRWGGAMIEAHHLKDTTEIEIIAYPLDRCGRPRARSGPIGRFIIVHPGFLDTADYQAGRAVSAAGRITGIRKGRLGEADYSFPLLESHKVHRWSDRDTRGGYTRPWVNLGIGGGDHGVFGGVGVIF